MLIYAGLYSYIPSHVFSPFFSESHSVVPIALSLLCRYRQVLNLWLSSSAFWVSGITALSQEVGLLIFIFTYTVNSYTLTLSHNNNLHGEDCSCSCFEFYQLMQGVLGMFLPKSVTANPWFLAAWMMCRVLLWRNYMSIDVKIIVYWAQK